VVELSFSNLSAAILPKIAADYYGDKKIMVKNILIQTGVVVAIGIPAVAISYIFCGKIIEIWLGPEFLPAIPLVKIMFYAVAIKIICYVISSLPPASGDAKASLISRIVSIVISISIIITYQSTGIIAFAYGLLGSISSYSILMTAFAFKLIIKMENGKH
jgi:O-antigen/teichoic acid export membrane protein